MTMKMDGWVWGEGALIKLGKRLRLSEIYFWSLEKGF
jgi:hypothetical protein